ncbi:PREDICTED: ecotropic viral integration site 5 protein homolog isoform X2 [Prunus mume]|uniref:Ecotropic viral integration site 5 protein homolog isoform X2 n=1 Tax=Prunus mume TaxID=102107 RepID=A0ABM1LPD7_PRUMU|nr:PREDICTED: ecotropic viral integration site 5 protein homolog isoform X2 [Prunus mume]
MLLSLLSKRSLEADSRDAYGFALRPQHVQRYREYSHIYKEEEEERSNKWKNFLEHVEKSSELCSPEKAHKEELQAEATEQKAETVPESGEEGNDTSSGKSVSGCSSERDPEKELQHSKETEKSKVQTWTLIRSSLCSIENMMSFRIRKGKIMKDKQIIVDKDHLPSEAASLGGASEDDVEEDVCFSDALNDSPDAFTAENSVSDGFSDSVKVAGEVEAMDGGVPNSVQSIGTEEVVANGVPPEPFFPWKLELESLVHGGVPTDLRGEVWQAFVGVKARRVERYYYELLAQETNTTESVDKDNSSGVPRKWRRQIEKDIPRTFPGHPALNEDGRNSLRRLLLAYARHNPSVGYCQAMNFFAGLLLLLMPEENAFWTLVGIIDDYFDGYYTEEMIESQVDQLVFEELMREIFPKLVNHLDYLGVQVAWFTGPWFLSIFVNMIPWESVIRVWDVLLFEGNRVMLFRTALALLELYGPALVTTKDAGDAITLLQSLVGSTFDSSQLVLTACMGFLAITETRLQELRDKHRPAVLAVVEERSKMGQVWKDSKGLASKLYSFKHDPIVTEEKNTTEEGTTDACVSHSKSGSHNLDELLSGTSVDSEVDSLPELQDQVIWLKVELCRVLEEKRSAVLRAEELETALMEIVKLDNRRELSARVEQLEKEVAELQQALADKTEQEAAMLKVLMWMEQEQKATEDARISAEQEVAVQKNAVHVLQEKYDKAMSSLTEMEKRVKVAESMLEATLQYESGQAKALKSPRAATTQGNTKKLGILSFGLGWRDRNKGASDLKSPSEQREPSSPKDKTGEEEKGHAK